MKRLCFSWVLVSLVQCVKSFEGNWVRFFSLAKYGDRSQLGQVAEIERKARGKKISNNSNHFLHAVLGLATVSLPLSSEAVHLRSVGHVMYGVDGSETTGTLAELPPLRYAFGDVSFNLECIAAVRVLDTARRHVEYITSDGCCYRGVLESGAVTFDGAGVAIEEIKEIIGWVGSQVAASNGLFRLLLKGGEQLYVTFMDQQLTASDGSSDMRVTVSDLDRFNSKGEVSARGQRLEASFFREKYLTVAEPQSGMVIKLPFDMIEEVARHCSEEGRAAVEELAALLPQALRGCLQPGLSVNGGHPALYARAANVIGLTPVAADLAEGCGTVSLSAERVAGVERIDEVIDMEALAREATLQSLPPRRFRESDEFDVPDGITFLAFEDLEVGSSDWDDDDDDEGIEIPTFIFTEREEDEEDFLFEFYVQKESTQNGEERGLLVEQNYSRSGEINPTLISDGIGNVHLAVSYAPREEDSPEEGELPLDEEALIDQILDEEEQEVDGEISMVYVESQYLPYAASDLYCQEQIAQEYERKGTLLPTMGQPLVMAQAQGFYIAKKEVTNEQYAQFIAATGHRPPSHWFDSRIPAGEGARSVVNVSYDDALAYARWVGKTLPTEEEWLRAHDLGLIDEGETSKEWVLLPQPPVHDALIDFQTSFRLASSRQ